MPWRVIRPILLLVVYVVGFALLIAVTAALIVTAPIDQFGTTTTSTTEPTLG